MTTLKRKIPAKHMPYQRGLACGDASFTLAAEDSNVRNVAIQLKDDNGRDIAVRARVRAYLANDTNGDAILPHYKMPSGGIAIGTDGLLIPGAQHDNALFAKGTLAIHSTPEEFATTTTALFRVNGVQYSKSAATALTFTAAHVVTASKFGVVLVQVDAAGTVSTKVPASPQAYNTAALALAALPAPDAGNVALGYIAIANNTGDWTANTDDLTDGSDVTTATFVDAAENGKFTPEFSLVSEADGDIDVNITHVGAGTFYLILEMPSGELKSSGAITFSA